MVTKMKLSLLFVAEVITRGFWMKKIALTIAVLLIFGSFAGCAKLDVVQKDAVRAFGEVLSAYPVTQTDAAYQLTAPDGGATFHYSNADMGIEVDAKPFIAAGLDSEKYALIQSERDSAVYTEVSETTLYEQSLTFWLPTFDMLNKNIKDTAVAQFQADLEYVRDKLGYHAVLDHYNIDFGGAMFEWAKDMTTNAYDNSDQDKDAVFVLDPAALIESGVDPAQVDGWLFAKVKVDIDGKMTEVDKFLKPFNIL